MSSLHRWPWFDDRIRVSDELLRAIVPGLLSNLAPNRTAGVYPALNLYEDGEGFLVRAELPGIRKESLEVTVKGDQLTVGGERQAIETSGKASFHRREREGGSFRRTVTLPQAVEGERISASYRNGVLEVTLPKVPELQPRRIQVQ